LLQDFLDRHINIRDLAEKEDSLITQIRENSARLNPLETSFYRLAQNRISLASIEKKLKIAEEGKLREIVGVQNKIASEKSLRSMIESIIQEYTAGLTLANFERDYTQLAATAGDFTSDTTSARALHSIHDTLETTNAKLRLKTREINVILTESAGLLSRQCSELKANHGRMENEIAAKIASLKTKGLASNLAELELLLRQKGTLGKEIGLVEQRRSELNQCRSQRENLLNDLTQIRSEMTKRRKKQLRGINRNLRATIKDYTVFVRYDEAGIIEDFCEFIKEKMTGSYLQDQVIEQLCNRITPFDLASCVLAEDGKKIASTTGISDTWARELVSRLHY
jgi:hypothetical protein